MNKLFTVLTLFVSMGLFAAIHNVPADFTTIQDAIDNSNNNDTIIVSQGNYIENLIISKPLTISSNYLFTQDTTDIETTIIDGNSTGSTIIISDIIDEEINIFGLTITGGSGTFSDPYNYGEDFLFGGGFFIENCSDVRLLDLMITENIITTEHNSGGGVYAYNSSIEIQNCNIFNNMINGGSFLGEGAGVFMYYSEGIINNTKITDNTGGQVYGNGGGVFSKNGSLTISNSDISRNSTINAGGIYCFDSEVTLDNIIVSDNDAQFSAALVIRQFDEDSCIITNSVFSQNHSSNSNGAIAINGSKAYIDNIQVIDNYGGRTNGGINFWYCDFNLSNSEISRNQSYSGIGSDAAGIEIYSCNGELSNLIIDSNECLNPDNFNEGGGIKAGQSTLIFDNVEITNNIADRGGALNTNSCDIVLKNCLISNNNAINKGGAIYSFGTNFKIINTTVSNNESALASVYSWENNFILVNTILWNEDETEIYFHTQNSDESYVDIAYCDVRGMEDNIITNNYGEVTWHGSNTDSDPMFVDPMDLDYHLLEGSSLIDAGTSYFELDGEVIVDYTDNEYYGNAPDMGAYESDYLTGITHNEEDINIKVFPNPVTDFISVENDISDKNEVAIYDLSGKLLINSETYERIDVRHFKPGSYILKVKSSNGFGKRIIVKI
jgi:hypothetical protein